MEAFQSTSACGVNGFNRQAGPIMSAELPFHPLANLFPMIEGAEFDELVSSIRMNGLREPVIIHEGMILDGRNRYRACRAAGVAPRLEVFDGLTDPLRFVIDRNLR